MSAEKKIIAIDAMGGDKGPNAVLGGMNQFLYQNGEDKVFFRLFGQTKVLNPLLAKYPRVARNCEVIDAPGVIKGTDKVRDVIGKGGRIGIIANRDSGFVILTFPRFFHFIVQCEMNTAADITGKMRKISTVII